MSEDWSKFRNQMPVTKRWSYFDHAAVGPLPNRAAEAIANWLQDAVENGDVHWPDWSATVNQLRSTAAALINADSSEIALVPSTTWGINFVAEGFPWEPGDNVVVPENEFPSNLYPWLNQQDRGVEVRQVSVENGRLDLERIAATCDRRTRIIALSWVGYASGWRVDVDEVCDIAKQFDACVMLDAIQGLGVFPIDVKKTPVDFIAADGHKWMLGPEGAGLFYVKNDRLDLLRPIGVGWNSVQTSFDFDHPEFSLRHAASRYEGGTQNMVGMIGLKGAIDVLVEMGVGPDRSAVAERVIEITDLACDKLTSIGAEILSPRVQGHKSGIVTFSYSRSQKTNEEIRSACRELNIVVSCRGGGIRISPHAYVDENDVDRLIDCLKKLR